MNTATKFPNYTKQQMVYTGGSFGKQPTNIYCIPTYITIIHQYEYTHEPRGHKKAKTPKLKNSSMSELTQKTSQLMLHHNVCIQSDNTF